MSWRVADINIPPARDILRSHWLTDSRWPLLVVTTHFWNQHINSTHFIIL